MTPPPLPRNEPARLASLDDYRLLDSRPEPVLDGLVRAAAEICGTPIALISLVDRERQWFKARHGLEGITETPRDIAFCAHAILGEEPLEVADALEDARFAGNPLVRDEPRLRFYFGVPLANADGHALGTLCVMDREPRALAAGQKLALQALAQAAMHHFEQRRRNLTASRLQSFLDQSPNQVVVFDCRDYRIAYANPAALRILGLTQEQGQQILAQMRFPELKRWLPEEEWGRQLASLHRGDIDQLNFEAGDRDAAGNVFPVRVRILHFRDHAGDAFVAIAQDIGAGRGERESAASARDDAGRLPRMIGAHTDVTHREELEEQLAETNRSLERTARERAAELQAARRGIDLFVASVSHDLRAPLRAISGFAGILQEEFHADCPPGAVQLLDRIRHNAEHMGGMIDGLRRLARDSNRSLERRAVDMNALLREVLAEFDEERDRRGVRLVLHALPPCQAAPDLLRIVLGNLLANAFKFTREKAQAEIEVGWHPDGLAGGYFVRDNGAGFDMEQAGELFRPWRRLHPESRFEGTGIGLSICARIVDRHGGRIWAESQPDAGATFCFTLL